MNRSIDKLMKQAKRSKRKVEIQLRRNDAPRLSKLCEQHEQEKQSLTIPIRVWGPYQDGPNRFRLKFAEGGLERSLSFSSLAEAEKVKEELLKEPTKHKRITVGKALEGWIKWSVEVKDCKPMTVQSYRQLGRHIPPRLVVSQVTESLAKEIYSLNTTRVSAHTKRPLAVATQHQFLYVMQHLWNWAMEQGYCSSNPWLKVTKIGKPKVGKQQLRIDEARKLEAVALGRAEAGDVAALGTLLMIYLGLRQGEVAERLPRDIDDDGRVLWVPSGKTKNARRRLKIPELLRPLILRLVQQKRPSELLFYPATHKRRHLGYYGVEVKRLCRLAGVPEVVPHSLRGLHATLALDGGATADAVAKALGHSSFAITAQHYASPSSVSNARASRVAEALGQHSAQPVDDQIRQQVLAELLKQLPPEELLRMAETAKERCRNATIPVDNQAT